MTPHRRLKNFQGHTGIPDWASGGVGMHPRRRGARPILPFHPPQQAATRLRRVFQQPVKPKIRGFTLVELLVVIAIIAILMSLVAPLLRRGRQGGFDIQCRNNLKSIITASTLQGMDHGGYLPGCYANSIGPLDWQRPFIGREIMPLGQAPLGWMDKDSDGTLAPYLQAQNAHILKTYRCPAIADAAERFAGSSNGLFDYVMFKALSGSRVSSIPLIAKLDWQNNPPRLPTPVFSEEDYDFNLNASNIDPGFSNEDYIASWHPNYRGNYAALDGSVNSVKAAIAPNRRAAGFLVGPVAWAWSVEVGPSKYADIADPGVNYGQWVKVKH